MINDNIPQRPSEIQIMEALHAEVQGRADALYVLLRHIESKKLSVTPEQGQMIYERRAALLESRDALHAHILKYAEGKGEQRHAFDKQILQLVESQLGKIDSLLVSLREYIPTPQRLE